jgi:hypothetical protein
VTFSPDQRGGGGETYYKTGDQLPGVVLRSGGSDYPLDFAVPNSADDTSSYTDAFAKESAAPIAVAGGSIRMAVEPEGPESDNMFTAWYQFTPADKTKPVFRFNLYNGRVGQKGTTPIDATAFKNMVESPGFAKLQQLLDPSVPASAAAVRERYSIEAKMNAEAAKVLPPGFRLKLNPGSPGGLELVGPQGVNTFDWRSFPMSEGSSCPVGALCVAVDSDHRSKQVGPDGKPRLGIYTGWTTTKSSAQGIVLRVLGKPQVGSMQIDPTEMGKPVETAPQGPGLTPQQARAIVKAPGITKVIDDVQRLAMLP